jgi:uncharacterized protein YxjI
MADTSLAYAPPTALSTDVFTSATYRIKRPFLSLFGRKFHVFDADGKLVMFVKHPIFKLRQEFTIFTDESQTTPIATIKAREIVAFNMSHDVTDAITGARLGNIRTKALKSIVRDTWEILDANDQPAGKLEEEGASILRRLFPILTGKWVIEDAGAGAGRIRQVFRFFVKEYALQLTPGDKAMDPRFALACTLMALMAETARESR